MEKVFIHGQVFELYADFQSKHTIAADFIENSRGTTLRYHVDVLLYSSQITDIKSGTNNKI